MMCGHHDCEVDSLDSGDTWAFICGSVPDAFPISRLTSSFSFPATLPHLRPVLSPISRLDFTCGLHHTSEKSHN